MLFALFALAHQTANCLRHMSTITFDAGDIISHCSVFGTHILLVLNKCDTKTETEFWNCLDLTINKVGIYMLANKRTFVMAKA